jgi:hypothetical protein
VLRDIISLAMPTSKQELGIAGGSPDEQRSGLGQGPQIPETSQVPEGGEAKPEPGRKRKEILPYEVVENISRNIEIDEKGNYHVWWGRGKERQHHGPSGSLEKVMDQHERVVMGYLGHRVRIPVRIGKTFTSYGKDFLEMKGESQKMAEIGTALLNLRTQFSTLATREDRQRLERKLTGLRSRIGRAKDAHKQAAASALEVAIVAPQLGVKMEKTGEAAKDIFERVQATIDKANGTIHRWNKCDEKRENWERILIRIYTGLIEFRKMIDEGKLGEEEKQKMVRQICGESQGKLKKSYVEWLSLITGLPYKKRAESPKLKRLAKVGEYVASGDDRALFRTLTEAIDLLWRVEDDRRERLKGERKEYLRVEGEK